MIPDLSFGDFYVENTAENWSDFNRWLWHAEMKRASTGELPFNFEWRMDSRSAALHLEH